MPETTIEWATHVWNPFTGCDRVSPSCARCYAATAAASLKRREQGRIDKAIAEGRPEPKVRYQRDGDPKSSGPGFGFTVHWDKLENPERFPAGARVFVNSMSDVFHEDAPYEAISLLFDAMAEQPKVNFLAHDPAGLLGVCGRALAYIQVPHALAHAARVARSASPSRRRQIKNPATGAK
jgi:protein gp37